MDPFFVPASLPFFSFFSPIFYTSRENKFYSNSGWRKYFYGGLFFKVWGAYPVHIGLRDYEKSLEHHLNILRAGGSLCIFPEGRTTPDGAIQPAKGGVAYLAYATGATIVPTRIRGVFRFSAKDFFLRRRHLSITYGKPMKFPTQFSVSPNTQFECRVAARRFQNIREYSDVRSVQAVNLSGWFIVNMIISL